MSREVNPGPETISADVVDGLLASLIESQPVLKGILAKSAEAGWQAGKHFYVDACAAYAFLIGALSACGQGNVDGLVSGPLPLASWPDAAWEALAYGGEAAAELLGIEAYQATPSDALIRARHEATLATADRSWSPFNPHRMWPRTEADLPDEQPLLS